MQRLTVKRDLGLEIIREIGYFVKDDPDGFYDIFDIARYADTINTNAESAQFNEILENISLRLFELENKAEDKEVIFKEGAHGGYYCPSCNAWFISVQEQGEKLIGTTPYCGNCGQKLKWEKE